jgi:hypothetical protein
MMPAFVRILHQQINYKGAMNKIVGVSHSLALLPHQQQNVVNDTINKAAQPIVIGRLTHKPYLTPTTEPSLCSEDNKG